MGVKNGTHALFPDLLGADLPLGSHLPYVWCSQGQAGLDPQGPSWDETGQMLPCGEVRDVSLPDLGVLGSPTTQSFCEVLSPGPLGMVQNQTPMALGQCLV